MREVEPASGTGRRDTRVERAAVAGPLVSSHAIDDCARLLLLDPLTPPARIAKLAEERETAIVLATPPPDDAEH